MQTLGVDLGTTFTKTSNERVFPSGISENIYLSNNVMEVEGNRYAMGIQSYKATVDVNINKSLNSNARLNYIYALFKEGIGEQIYYSDVKVSFPCSQWKNNDTVESYKQLLNVDGDIEVCVNGQRKTIFVEGLEVYPEGAMAYYSKEMNNERFNGEKVILLDWGGLTLNQLSFKDNELIDMHTDEFGVLKMYKEIAEKITSETGINVLIEDMDDILKSGLYHKGHLIETEPYIRNIAIPFCGKIYKDLKLRWGIDTIKHMLMIGGGSIAFTKYLQHYTPHAELQENAQLLAVIGLGEE